MSIKLSKKFETFSKIFDILPDNGGMEGMTVSEIAKELRISVDAVRKRIETAGIQPITREALYDSAVVEDLRKIRMGRPKKAKK